MVAASNAEAAVVQLLQHLKVRSLKDLPSSLDSDAVVNASAACDPPLQPTDLPDLLNAVPMVEALAEGQGLLQPGSDEADSDAAIANCIVRVQLEQTLRLSTARGATEEDASEVEGEEAAASKFELDAEPYWSG